MKDRKEYFRKKKAEYRKEHKRVELQLSNQEYRQWQTIAKREKLSVNQVIKQMATAYKDNSYFIPTETNEKLSKIALLIRNIANNINQMAKHSNIFSRMVHNQRVMARLKEMEKGIADLVKNGKS